MKKEIAEKWGEALLSEEYTQCSGQLMTVEEEGGSRSYCCLGVLTKILPLGKDLESRLGTDSTASLAKSAGYMENPDPPIYDRGSSFSYVNDIRGESFKDIGTFILLAAEAGINKGW